MAEGLGASPCLAAPEISQDALFGGRLLLRQPRHGHRSGTDAVLLAMAAAPGFAGHAIDVGSGVGACGLGLARFTPAARVTLIERDPLAADLARENAVHNALAGRVAVERRDILSPVPQGSRLDAADLVLTNPPFYEAERARSSPVALRRDAHVLHRGTSTADWLRACLALLAEKGTLILIHTPGAVPDILSCLRATTGAITLLPVLPRAGVPARRVLIRAIKGSRAPFAIAAPLVLHAEHGFTPQAEAVHRGDERIAW